MSPVWDLQPHIGKLALIWPGVLGIWGYQELSSQAHAQNPCFSWGVKGAENMNTRQSPQIKCFGPFSVILSNRI